MAEQWHDLLRVGEHPCLGFLNTVGDQGKTREQERLADYATALAWAEAADFVTSREKLVLAAVAEGDPDRRAVAYGALIGQRESFYRLFSAVAVGEVPPDTVRSPVEACFREAIGIARLAVGQGGPGEWVVDVASEPLHVIRFRTALSAEGLLRSADLSRLRQCDACTWLFIDRSKGGRRRWCSMATCGNRAKARRHYRRDQAA